MLPSLWIGKTGLDSHSRVIDVVAQNVSNANTTAYKKQRALFSDLFYQTIRQPEASAESDSALPLGLHLGSGSAVESTQTIFTQSKMDKTDHEYDMAINGEGFFKVVSESGIEYYTRDGHFILNEDNQLVSTDGHLLQPEVAVESNQKFQVDQNGKMSVSSPNQGREEIGTITLYLFSNKSGLDPKGSGLYEASDSSGEAIPLEANTEGAGKIIGGYLEASNVNISEELINMITAQRAFEINTKVVSASDSMLSNLNQRIG